MREKLLVGCSRFHRFAGFDKNPLIDLLYNERLRRILYMINLGEDEKSIVLDLGCSKGHFSHAHAEYFRGKKA